MRYILEGEGREIRGATAESEWLLYVSRGMDPVALDGEPGTFRIVDVQFAAGETTKARVVVKRVNAEREAAERAALLCEIVNKGVKDGDIDPAVLKRK